MKQKKLKYSLEDPMVGTLCGLLLFLTVGCLFAGSAQSRTAFKIGIDAAFGGANKGFTGYIDSEYEGQRDQQDRGKDYLPNEVEEVRRHHEMLKRLIGE